MVLSNRQQDVTDAVFLYMGILDAYEAIAEELIGEDVLEEQVLPRMVYYVRNFLPELVDDKDEEEIVHDLKFFLDNLRDQVYNEGKGTKDNVTMDDVWEVRAAIFGYESVFLDILGENVIETYVLKRIADILSVYLPEVFKDKDLSLRDKLNKYSNYLKDNGFVEQAGFKLNQKNRKIEYSVNYCAFAKIHDSDAYLEGNTRFCPWGMIANAITTAHNAKENPIKDCRFTTRGSITRLEMLEE